MRMGSPIRNDIEDRNIWSLAKKGYSARKIAERLKCSHQIISQRLKRLKEVELKEVDEYLNREEQKAVDDVFSSIRELVKVCKKRSRTGAPKGDINRKKKDAMEAWLKHTEEGDKKLDFIESIRRLPKRN